MKRLVGQKILVVVSLALLPSLTHAHCPLCTAGAGILAVVAVSLGVPAIVIATLLGGFTLALGLWFARLIKKKYMPYQDQLIAWLVYFSTTLPLWPILKEYKTLYAPFLGFDKYANKVPVDLYLVGVVIGAIILLVSPYISRKISSIAGKQMIPFQGIIITMILLVVAPLLVNSFFLI